MSKLLKILCCLLSCCVLACLTFMGCTDTKQNPPDTTTEVPGDEEKPGENPGGEDPMPERDIEALNPADNGTASRANETVAAFVKNYEPRSSKRYTDGTDMYAPAGLDLSWSCKQSAESYTVTLSRSRDMSEPVTYQTAESQLHIDDLFVATDYYWQVTAETEGGTALTSDVFHFTTAEEPRTISVEGVSNTRDIGGYAALDGKRVKQGMVYRGGQLAKTDEDGNLELLITEAGKQKLLETYGIRTDLDLRGSEGKEALVGTGVQYINISAPSYASGISAAANKKAIADIIKVFADEENYPIYMHCAIGRDRTGTVAMLLETLLGVGINDFYLDYEMSLFSVAGCSDDTPVNKLMGTYFDPTYYYIDEYGKNADATLAEKCEQFLIDCGVTADEIAAIRSILLV